MDEVADGADQDYEPEIGRELMDAEREEPGRASVRYLVDDIPAAVAFYTQNLAFEASLVASPEIAVLSKGALRLVLSGPASSAAIAGPDGRRPAPGGWNRIQLVVHDLEGTVHRLDQAGVVTRSGLVEGRGGRQIVIEDPSGNPVELFQAHG